MWSADGWERRMINLLHTIVLFRCSASFCITGAAIERNKATAFNVHRVDITDSMAQIATRVWHAEQIAVGIHLASTLNHNVTVGHFAAVALVLMWIITDGTTSLIRSK